MFTSMLCLSAEQDQAGGGQQEKHNNEHVQPGRGFNTTFNTDLECDSELI